MSICPDLRNNGRKKLLFLGVTGSGKSALCNVLSQPVKTDDTPPTLNFPESKSQKIGNTQTILKNINFLGRKFRRNNENISFIDTVGFNSTEMTNTAVAELIVSLKDSCDFIHLFAIVVSSPKRIEASLKETIELFKGMFGKEEFWNNSVVIITNLSQSDDEISRRSMRNSDEQLIKDFNTSLVETFDLERFIPTFIIDAHYRGSKPDERDRFQNSANSLCRLLMDSTGMSVCNVENVTGRLEGLQEEVDKERKERRKAQREAEKAQREAEKAQREAKNARKKAEKAEFTKNCVVGAGCAIVAAGLGIMAAPVLVPAAVTTAQAAAATATTAASAAAASATTAAAAAASEGGAAAVVTATAAAAVALTR